MSWPAVIDNPSAAPSADVAEERLAKLVDALSDAEQLALYNLLHARGRRVEWSYIEQWKRRWKSAHP